MSRGFVYLIHLDPGLPVTGARIANHYVGWTKASVQKRLQQHLDGVGSPLIKAVIAAGGTAKVVRTWPNRGRDFERWLHKTHESREFCPVCTARPRQTKR